MGSRYEYMKAPRREPMFDFRDFAAFRLKYFRWRQQYPIKPFNGPRTQAAFTF